MGDRIKSIAHYRIFCYRVPLCAILQARQRFRHANNILLLAQKVGLFLAKVAILQ